MKMHKTIIKTSLVLMILAAMLFNENMAVTSTTVGDINQAAELASPGQYRLKADISLSTTMVINKGQSYYIDLNGFKITSTVETDASKTDITSGVENHGTLIIEDTSNNKTGTITSDALFGIWNYGDLTIKSGNFKSDVIGKKITINNISEKYNARIIRNEGSLVIHEGNFQADGGAINTRTGSSTIINGGTFVSTSSNQSKVNGETGYWTYCVTNNGKMVVNNATIKGIQGALSSSSGELYVYDGDFSTDWNNPNSFYALYIAGEVDKSKGFIYGGNYSSKKTAIYIGNDGADGGQQAEATVSIYGGEFIGEKRAISIAKKTANDPLINGGSYFTAPSSTGNKTVCPIIKDYLNENYMQHEITGKVLQKITYSLALSDTKLILEVGKKQTLTATLTPSDSTSNEVTWSSTNPNIASVNSNGEVTAKAAGTANITATSKDKTAICEVKVYKKEAIELPKTDPTKPVDEVTIGINDAVSLENTIQALFQGNSASFVSDTTYNNIVTAIDAGKVISVSMACDLILNGSLSPTTVESFHNQANLLAGTDKTAVIAQYLDLSIELIAENDKLGSLNQLVEPLAFSIALPQALVETNREYYVLRLHEGAVTALPATLNGTTLTFETDQFSTFALVYIDKVISMNPDADGAVQLPSTDQVVTDGTMSLKQEKNTGTASTVKGVNTGTVSTNMNEYLLMMGISLTIIITFRKKLRSK